MDFAIRKAALRSLGILGILVLLLATGCSQSRVINGPLHGNRDAIALLVLADGEPRSVPVRESASGVPLRCMFYKWLWASLVDKNPFSVLLLDEEWVEQELRLRGIPLRYSRSKSPDGPGSYLAHAAVDAEVMESVLDAAAEMGATHILQARLVEWTISPDTYNGPARLLGMPIHYEGPGETFRMGVNVRVFNVERREELWHSMFRYSDTYVFRPTDVSILKEAPWKLSSFIVRGIVRAECERIGSEVPAVVAAAERPQVIEMQSDQRWRLMDLTITVVH